MEGLGRKRIRRQAREEVIDTFAEGLNADNGDRRGRKNPRDHLRGRTDRTWWFISQRGSEGKKNQIRLRFPSMSIWVTVMSLSLREQRKQDVCLWGGISLKRREGAFEALNLVWVTCWGLVEMPSEPRETVERDLGGHLCVLYKEPARWQPWCWYLFSKLVFIIVSSNFMLMVKTWGRGIISSHFLGCSLWEPKGSEDFRLLMQIVPC